METTVETPKPNFELYYNIFDILSKNRLINFILSVRGDGKSFGGKYLTVKHFLEKGYQSVWIRRYENEFDTFITFFDDIKKYFPDHRIEKKGLTFLCDGKIMAFLIPLSLSTKYKSSTFDKVKYIFFDEFVSEDGKILQGEANRLKGIYETIARAREGVRLFCFANTISIYNTHFETWNIKPNLSSRFTLYSIEKHGKSILIDICIPKQYIEFKNKTTFGKMIKDDEYGQSMIQGAFLLDNDCFIKKTPQKNISFLFGIKAYNRKYGIWEHGGNLYINNRIIPNSRNIYNIESDRREKDQEYIKNKSSNLHIMALNEMFNQGKVFFNDLLTKRSFYENCGHLIG